MRQGDPSKRVRHLLRAIKRHQTKREQIALKILKLRQELENITHQGTTR